MMIIIGLILLGLFIWLFIAVIIPGATLLFTVIATFIRGIRDASRKKDDNA